MASKLKQFEGRLYLGRDKSGRERYEWVGRFATEKERDTAVMRRRVEREQEAKQAKHPAGERITCSEWVDRYLARYERDRKGSSYDTARSSLSRFKADFGDRPLASLERHKASEWAERVPPWRVPIVVTLLNAAVDQELLDKNPFRGLGHRTRGRRDEHPPTPEEFDRLLAGCAALGDYAPQMQALLIFGAYTGMRPGELFALEWSDIDCKANRVHVQRRLYRGGLDLPKSNKTRTIALPPPARDAVLRQRTRLANSRFSARQGSGCRSPSCPAIGDRCSPAPDWSTTSTWPPSTSASTCSTSSAFQAAPSALRWDGRRRRLRACSRSWQRRIRSRSHL